MVKAFIKRLFTDPRLIMFVIVLVVSTIFLIVSAGYDYRSKIAPFSIAIIALSLTVFALTVERYEKLGEFFQGGLFNTMATAKKEADRKTGVKDSEEEQKHSAKNLVSAVLFIFGSFFAMLFVGIIIGGSLSMIVWIKYFGKMSWFKAMLSALITAAFMFLIFQEAMGLKLFKGILFGGLIT
jgi:uncharacterized membrane protein YraQ (UPF0718 family)